MLPFEQEYFRIYPGLLALFVCEGCNKIGTSLAYSQGNTSEPLLDDNGVQLLDKQGNPRTVDRFVWVCKFCGDNQQTRMIR